MIEKASGMTYEDYVEQKIFAPLGMKRSMYCRIDEVVERRAHGYGYGPQGVRRAPHNIHTWPFAAGSLCSTAGDMVTWLQALHGGKVLPPKSYAEMIAPSKLNDGTPIRYGMGISVGNDPRGFRKIGHGGAITGFVAEASWYPDAQLAVVVLQNGAGRISPAAVGAELAGAIIPGTMPTMKPFTGDVTPFLGTFKGPSRGREAVVVISRQSQGIGMSLNGGPIRPLSWEGGQRFRYGADDFLAFAGDVLKFDAGGGLYVLKRQ